jgi:hypothetical protein
MITLRIEHAIHDYDQWKEAFDGFAQVRLDAGVGGHTIHRPVDDPNYLMLDLEFETVQQAEGFGRFLEERVWSSPDAAPALAGVPRLRLLELREEAAGGGPSAASPSPT